MTIKKQVNFRIKRRTDHKIAFYLVKTTSTLGFIRVNHYFSEDVGLDFYAEGLNESILF
jgi:hypothetical protein